MKEIEQVLYVDIQAERPAGFCPACGRELYVPTLTCRYCEKSAERLAELSRSYERSAQLLRTRMKELRQSLRQTDDPEECWHLKRRLAELTPILTQMNELAELTAHYYDRGYWRNEKYTV